jgi:hypothetical protein
MGNLIPFLIGAGIFLIISFIIMMVIESTRCPVCKKTFVVKNLGTLEVGRKKGYRTVTREEKDREGKVVHRWDEQIRVLTVEYLQNHECRNCHHTWSTNYTAEFDNFDDE